MNKFVSLTQTAAAGIQSAIRELNKNFLISEKVADLIFGGSSQGIVKVINAKGPVEDALVYSLGKKYSI